MDVQSSLPYQLIRNKLLPPLPVDDHIERRRLLNDLRAALGARRLTLLSAPAGYGKTTLLSTLANDAPGAVAWLSVDELLNDPILFTTYLLAALQHIHPNFGAQTQSLLERLSNALAPIPQLTAALTNDMLDGISTSCTLVIDDLHAIDEPFLYLLLDHLLENLPAHMHLVINTRHDPPLSLARLRARGHLAEWRVPDLRFSLEETTYFLNYQHRCGLSGEDMAALYEYTEGWPASLRLLSIALEHIAQKNRPAYIHNLINSEISLFDYLAEEILDRQPVQVRAFLLETAILSELTPDLCQAVTQDEKAAEMLLELHRRNLVLRLQPDTSASQAPIYRCHALLAEFLRRRLETEQPEQIAELHQRAAQASIDTFQAIPHFLAAKMWEQAAQIIERVSREMFQRGQMTLFAAWVRALPFEILQEHPQLVWLLGNCVLLQGDFRQAQELLSQAWIESTSRQDEDGQVAALANLATGALLEADFEHASQWIKQALTRPAPPYLVVQLLISRAWLFLFSGDLVHAASDLSISQEITEKSNDPLTWMVLAMGLKPDFIILPDGLERIERFCRLATIFADGTPSPLALVLTELQTFLHLWRGRLAQSAQTGEQALRIKDQLGGFPFVGGDAAACAAMAYAALEDYDNAQKMLAALQQQNQATGLGQAAETPALYLSGRIAWSLGDQETARQTYAQMCAAASQKELPTAAALRAMLEGILHMMRRRYGQAERLFKDAEFLERQAPATALLGSAKLLLARLYLDWKRPSQALDMLRPILARCQKNGTPGLILKEGAAVVPALQLAARGGELAGYAGQLLAILGGESEQEAVPHTGERLTRREMEVLRLLAAGASNQTIAEKLVITQRTAKAHVSNIMHKLDASSRTQAVAQASELGLL